jgi:hypothetical protein
VFVQKTRSRLLNHNYRVTYTNFSTTQPTIVKTEYLVILFFETNHKRSPESTTLTQSRSATFETAMPTPTVMLNKLKNELGERWEFLQHAPYSELVTGPLEDDEEPLAISFKLLFGYICVKPGDTEERAARNSNNEVAISTRQEIWIHFYPPERSESPGEIMFCSYTESGRFVDREDSNNICKTTSGTAPAFAVPAGCRPSRIKISALAKYYFLRKLVEMGTKKDAELMRYGMSFSASFKDSLATACREFQEDEMKEKRSLHL